MLIINNEDVAALLTMADCIRVQQDAFSKIPYGGAIHRPRIDVYMPCDRPDGYYRWSTMEGANNGYMAIRMKSDVITWPRGADGNWTEEWDRSAMQAVRGAWMERDETYRQRRRTGVTPNTPVRSVDGEDEN